MNTPHHHLYVCALALTIGAFVSSTATGQTTQADLRAYTEFAARTEVVTLPRPIMDWSRNPIVYMFDNTIEHDPETDPMIIPLNAQFTVTSIRRYRNTPQQRQFWTPVLRRVESEIAKMLDLINREELRGEELLNALYERSGTIGDIYQEELSRLAQANGKEGAVTEWRVRTYFVDLRTDPADGVIKYMPAGRWSLYEFMTQQRGRQDYPEPEWITVQQLEGVKLKGKYWFKIWWPDDVERRELVRISNDQPITFRKNVRSPQ